MRVKGWLLIGRSTVQTAGSGMLMPVSPPLEFRGELPDAASYLPGTIGLWWPHPDIPPTFVCCIEVPV